MKFLSTKNPSLRVSLEDVLLKQLSAQDGLYMPEVIPTFSAEELISLKTKTLQEIGVIILEKYIGDDIEHDRIKQIVYDSLNFPIPIRQVGPNLVLELFHGPTYAFKDIGARILARLLDHYAIKSNKHITVIAATSGDTGGAVANGFGDLSTINAILLYPQSNVSKLQEEQLTRVADNVYPIAVQGTFDECQKMVKQCFSDPNLLILNLTTANSINIGRLIAQTIYYVYCWSQFQKNNMRFIVPSGNMGNVTAGLLAQKMGIPIDSFVAACNENDPVVKYYNTGIYTPQDSVRTLSNAMDIGDPSNFERILYLCNNDNNEFKKHITAVKVTDKETIQAIQEVHTKYNYLLDPHSAVAWKANEMVTNDTVTNVIVSTASPLKFAVEIKKRTQIDVDATEVLQILQQRAKKKYISENNYFSVKEIIMNELINK